MKIHKDSGMGRRRTRRRPLDHPLRQTRSS